VVRLGGIYALEGVMNTSEQYHQPVLEALCAFVRDGTKADLDAKRPRNTLPRGPRQRTAPRAAGAEPLAAQRQHDRPTATEIQAVLTVIGRRAAIGTGSPNLANVLVPGANLIRANLMDANLTAADLSGANLTEAYLDDADLEGAKLKVVDLSRTHLSDATLAKVDLTHADLSYADLSGADLSGANLENAKLGDADSGPTDYYPVRSSLDQADLSGANVTQTQLDQTCGTNVRLDPGLTIKPCHPQ
jgi:hypothetical protein